MGREYRETAEEIIELLGGLGNISSISHCMTRLHFTVKNKRKVQLDALKQTEEVIKVVVSNNQYQIVIGEDVADIYDEIIRERESMPARGAVSGIRSFFMEFSTLISKVYFPFAGVISAAGMLKGLLLLASTLGILDPSSAASLILGAVSEGILYFLPMFVSYTAAVFFGANPYIAMAASAAFLYPGVSAGIASLISGGIGTAMEISETVADYSCSVFPPFAAAYLQSRFEKWLRKVLPALPRDILLTFLSLTGTSVLTFLVIGPVMNWISDGIAAAVRFLIGLSPAIAGMLFGAFYPILIVLGLQWGLIPVYFAGFRANGFDNFMIFTVATNFILAGVALGVYLKSRDKKMKSVSFSAFLSALIGGVTEPSVYSCTVRFRKPLVIVCLVDAVCGFLIGATNTVQYALVSWNLLSIPALVGGSSIYTLYAILIGFFSATALVYLFGYDDRMLEETSRD